MMGFKKGTSEVKIQYKVGNLLDAVEPCLLQSCNARGVMNSGVAKVIRQEYPRAFEVYYAEHIARGLKLGTVVWVDCRDNNGGHLIGNLIGQGDYGREAGRVYTDYDALRSGLIEANRYLKEQGISDAAFPLIGSGLGQGKWSEISVILEETFTDVKPIVYVLNESLIPADV